MIARPPPPQESDAVAGYRVVGPVLDPRLGMEEATRGRRDVTFGSVGAPGGSKSPSPPPPAHRENRYRLALHLEKRVHRMYVQERDHIHAWIKRTTPQMGRVRSHTRNSKSSISLILKQSGSSELRIKQRVITRRVVEIDQSSQSPYPIRQPHRSQFLMSACCSVVLRKIPRSQRTGRATIGRVATPVSTPTPSIIYTSTADSCPTASPTAGGVTNTNRLRPIPCPPAAVATAIL
ncbi:hypothetical protein B0F90DRAFT_1160305 [Multifurca ochricompacta]|uniref:Uncharacterized protein n=1 Tax=Multifurca ochricompacta TaxID=376703 RepID=A0AAD4M8A9_9AGAM|nr:hypothetical protein B0F90DRAFT_1160305 [Multifurca ochricompacta]